MTKIIVFRAHNHPEVTRLFKQEKIKSWQIDSGLVYLEIHDNEEVKLD